MTQDPINPANACDQSTPASPSTERINSLNLSYPALSTLQSGDVSATLVPEKVLSRQHVIIGRATIVVRIESDVEKKTTHPLALKLSFLPRGRIVEEKTRDFVKKNLVHDSVFKHPSRMLHSDHLDGNTTVTQSRLVNLFEREMNSTAYDTTDARILVMAVLVPIKNIKQGDELLSALVGVVTGYKWHYEKMGVIHRDMNIENMMYRLDGEGNINGVLIDYDHAIQRNRLVITQRTGTRPYMAIDLLRSAKPLVHLCRHDLESIMYSVLDLACYRHASVEVQKASPIHLWFNPEFDEITIAAYKVMFLTTRQSRSLDTAKGMGKLAEVVRSLYYMFARAQWHRAQALDEEIFEGAASSLFDDETMGGHVTLSSLAKIFGI